jgi:hypothetical protein
MLSIGDLAGGLPTVASDYWKQHASKGSLMIFGQVFILVSRRHFDWQ